MVSRRKALRVSSCIGKKTFRTATSAMAEIETYERNRISLGGLHPYKCPFGAHLHIGHSKDKFRIHAFMRDFPLKYAEVRDE